MKTPIKLENFDGHLVLYCKGHYTVKDCSVTEGFRKLWSIRCGYNYDKDDKSVDRYIANHLYKIMITLLPHKEKYLHEILHDRITHNYAIEEGLTPIERIIIFYWAEIQNAQIKEKENNKWIDLILLPKPNKRVIKRILRGNGRYKDYTLVF